jgi:hypothetical protein
MQNQPARKITLGHALDFMKNAFHFMTVMGPNDHYNNLQNNLYQQQENYHDDNVHFDFKKIFDKVSERYMRDDFLALREYFEFVSICSKEDLKTLYDDAYKHLETPLDRREVYREWFVRQYMFIANAYRLIVLQGFVQNPQCPDEILEKIKNLGNAGTPFFFYLNEPLTIGDRGYLNLSALQRGVQSLYKELQNLIEARETEDFKATKQEIAAKQTAGSVLLFKEGIIKTYLDVAKQEDEFINRLLDAFNILAPQRDVEEFRTEARKLYTLLQKIDITRVDDLVLTRNDRRQDRLIFVLKFILTLGILPLIEGIIGKSVILQYNFELKAQISSQQSSFVDFISSKQSGGVYR